MQRFLILIVLLSLSLPVGLSIAGCGHNTNNYCLKNGHAYGPTTNQVIYITLQPETTGLSLAWGQTSSLSQPHAYNCLNGTETVSSYTYATTNNALADISPSGIVCAGSWNRYSEGTVAPYTVCTPPSGAAVGNCGTTANPTAGNNTACGVAQVSATAAAVTSNPVNVYVHPPISSIVIGSTAGTTGNGTATAGGAITQSQCYSQDTTVQNPAAPGTPETLLSETEVLGADGTPIPMADVGTINYTASPATVVTINNTTNPSSAATTTGTTTGTTTTSTTAPTTTTTPNPNGTVTANQPGAAVITASLSGSSSAAGYFYTCPPKTINLAINGQSGTAAPVTITASAPQTITATVTDTNGVTLNGTALAYTSTEPQNISVASTGVVTPIFPSTASIIGICQPPGCNPSPITGTSSAGTGTQIGFYGTGLPVVSNRLQVQSPGQVSDQIWMASSQSQYFSEVDLTTGTTGTTVQLPYVPNSMVADQGVNSLYFGSYRELMIYSTATNHMIKADTNVPGVVLAVSPTNSTVIINDQLRQVIYLYNVATGTSISTDGVATHAEFSPDGNTVYVTGPNALYIYNSNTGWSTESISNTETASCTPPLNNDSPLAQNYSPTTYDPYCGRDLTVTVPQDGPYVAGSTTTAYSFCADTTVNPTIFYPAADTAEETDHLAATPNGNHIIGASATPGQLTDLWLYADSGLTTPGVPTGACPQATATTTAGENFYHYAVPAIPLSGITPSEIDQVVSSPNSSVAFVTYQSTGTPSGILPSYEPSATPNAAGTLTNIQLNTDGTTAPGDPIAGAFSPDASIFFVSTTGDRLVHMLTTSPSSPNTWTDTGYLNPELTTPAGTAANTGQQPTAPQFIVVKSRTAS
jgi:trimeric autotransporter adhesin